MTEQLTEERTDTDVVAVPGPLRVAWAPVPKVNLLPIEIVESRRFRRTQLLLGGAVLSALLIAAGGTYLAQQDINDAHDQLDTAQAKVSALVVEQAKYATVPKVLAEVDAARNARTLALGSDVLWYKYLNDLDAARPPGVEFTGLTVTTNGASAVDGTFADPLTPNGVGTLSVEGSGKRYDQVATWMESVNKIAGLSAAKLTNAAKDDLTGDLTFTSGGVVDPDALSGRYDKKAG